MLTTCHKVGVTIAAASRQLLSEASADLTRAANRCLTQRFTDYVRNGQPECSISRRTGERSAKPPKRAEYYDFVTDLPWPRVIMNESFNATVKPQLDYSRFDEVVRGTRALASFRRVPLLFSAAFFRVEEGAVFVKLRRQEVKGARGPAQWHELKLGVREQKNARTRTALRSSKTISVVFDDRKQRWTASIAYPYVPAQAQGDLIAGIDVGVRDTFAIAIVDSDGAVVRCPKPQQISGSVAARAWKYRDQRRRGAMSDRYFKYRDQAFDKACHRLLTSLKGQGVSVIHVEGDLQNLARLWGHREAAQFLPGDLIGTHKAPGRLLQMAERYGLQWAMVPAKGTSRTCAKCGAYYPKKDFTDPRGPGRHGSDFRCTCGHRGNADRNAAINIARAKPFAQSRRKVGGAT